jgi:transcription termination factor Rho
MAVLDRSELEASPLADLHAIADQLGLEGFRRMRKADLIDAILGERKDPAADSDSDAATDSDEPKRAARPRRRRAARSAGDDAGSDAPAADSSEDEAPRGRSRAKAEPKEDAESERSGARRGRGGRTSAARERGARSSAGERTSRDSSSRDSSPRESPSRESSRERSEPAGDAGEDTGRTATGVVEVLGNGSAFLRVDPPQPSDEDVYISAAQVRRCELVSGDQVSGPVRTPRRSERYPSLVRIDTINGDSADAVSDGVRYEELPVAWPSERLALGGEDPTVAAIEWLTPLGLGSRAVIVGARHAGKSETLRRVLDAVHGREELEISVVLSGARPEEIAQWQEGPVAPAAALSFAASADAQGQAVERAIDAAKRVAARGGNALVLIDSLDALSPHAARKALSAARNLREGGSLTLIATATAPLGGETTVIALDATLTSSGRQPILDLLASGTLRPELLVGEDGAQAITKARSAALEDAG